MVTIEQYDIYWVDLDPTRGGEMTKTRPCVVVSLQMNDIGSNFRVNIVIHSVEPMPPKSEALRSR